MSCSAVMCWQPQSSHSQHADDKPGTIVQLPDTPASTSGDNTLSNDTDAMPYKHRRSYCSFPCMFITAALIQLAVAIAIWFLGYHTSLQTVDSLSESYRTEFMQHAVDKTIAVLQTPLTSLNQLDYLFQRLVITQLPMNSVRNDILFTDMTHMLTAALPDLTSLGYYIPSTNVAFFLQSHYNDTLTGYTYELMDNTTAPNTLTYYYQSAQVLQPFNYSMAAIKPAASFMQPTPYNAVANYTPATRPWAKLVLASRQVNVNIWSPPFSVISQSNQQGYVLAVSRGGSFDGTDSGTSIDYVITANVRMYPVITNLLSSIPVGSHGRTYLLSTDLLLLAYTNASNPYNPINTTVYSIDINEHPALGAVAPYIIAWRNQVLMGTLSAGETTVQAVSVKGSPSHLQLSVVTPDSSLFLILAIITQDSEFDGGLDGNIITTAVATAILCFVTAALICSMVLCLNRPVKRIVKFMSQLTTSDSDDALKTKLHSLHDKWLTAVDEPLLQPRGSCSMASVFSADGSTTLMMTPDNKASQSAGVIQALKNVLSVIATAVRPLTSRLQINELRILGDTFESMLLRLIESSDSVSLANEQKQQFMRFVFHEVRVPLNAITLGVEQLKDTKSLPSDVLEVCDILAEQASAVTRILNDVLSIQRIEDNRLTLEFKQFNLNKFVLQTVQSFQAEFAKKQLNVTATIDGFQYAIANAGQRVNNTVTLSSNQCVYVLGDMYRLRQCFSNFITNACKFTPTNGNIDVQVTHVLNMSPPIPILTQNSDMQSFIEFDTWHDITLSVIDNGVGVSEADISALFQPYRQINAAELQQGKGSGLGLSIAKRLIAMHGGHVGCASKPTVRTEFYFTVTLPVLQCTPQMSADTIDMTNSVHDLDIQLLDTVEVESRRSSHGLSYSQPIRTASLPDWLQASERVYMSRSNDTSRRNTPLTHERELMPRLCTAPTISAEASQSDPISNLLKQQVLSPPPSIPRGRLAVNKPRAMSPGRAQRILVVEDSAPNRKLLVNMLQRMSPTYVVDSAENGQVCIDKFIQHSTRTAEGDGTVIGQWPFDLILMDGQMPVMNGFDATRELRKLGVLVPIVAVTGNALNEDVQLFKQAGVNHVLTKPLQKDKLKEILDQYVNTSEPAK